MRKKCVHKRVCIGTGSRFDHVKKRTHSSGVEHSTADREVTGSNPVGSLMEKLGLLA